MAKFSIKTADGDRVDCSLPLSASELMFDLRTNYRTWIEVSTKKGTRFINSFNIVSIDVISEGE